MPAAKAKTATATAKEATGARKSLAVRGAKKDEPEPVAPKSQKEAPKKATAGRKSAVKTEEAKPAKKAAAPKTAPSTTATTKRKHDETKAPAPKRTKTVKEQPLTPSDSTAASPPAKTLISIPAAAKKRVINSAPSAPLEVFVFGDGSNGELGLGPEKSGRVVKRPRLNKFLDSNEVGVVQISVGGMHTACLTKESKIYTWGVNDQGALGRDTTWSGGLRDMDADEDSDSDDEGGLNPHESTPTAIPGIDNVRFTQVVAGDSTTFAVTEEGLVAGWGTFRSNEGILGFSAKSEVQTTPTLVKGLTKIKSLAAGANHILSLDEQGHVLAWGSGQQNQLGRRVVERSALNGLTPQSCGLTKKQNIRYIACGSYHSLAIDESGRVYCWGANNFGECGVSTTAGEAGSAVLKPALVEALEGHNIVQVAGGEHHSVAVSDKGECFVWGRLDGYQCGINLSALATDDAAIIRDARGNARILAVPRKLDNIPPVAYAACGPDHTIAVTKDGKAYSWGFSVNFQTGQGPHQDGEDQDIETPTLIDNTAVREKKLNWVGCGGQFSVLTSIAESGVGSGLNTP